MIYYNDNDPFCAAWLRELIKAGHLPYGEVDERSIKEVDVQDLRQYTQCHFFAGIGGWARALQLAGWGERPVWTGSCPCQPFSAAGKCKGVTDDRHLWPEFYRLIKERKPSTVFGEQVASPLGRKWLQGVFIDLEEVGYAVAGADLCAAGIGAPHIRQRVWWVGNANSTRLQGWGQYVREHADQQFVGKASKFGRMGYPLGRRDENHECGEIGGTSSRVQTTPQERQRIWAQSWEPSDVIPCRDGKGRRVEPSTFPVAHGIPARVGRLRGYGNAIVPQVAATFIQACLEGVR